VLMDLSQPVRSALFYMESAHESHKAFIRHLFQLGHKSVICAECYESSILSPVPFMGIHGEILGWLIAPSGEVKYEYEYLYEYYPSVITARLAENSLSVVRPSTSSRSRRENPRRHNGGSSDNYYELSVSLCRHSHNSEV
jgi:hypothetical protein